MVVAQENGENSGVCHLTWLYSLQWPMDNLKNMFKILPVFEISNTGQAFHLPNVEPLTNVALTTHDSHENSDPSTPDILE
jgi:hypothetical protein